MENKHIYIYTLVLIVGLIVGYVAGTGTQNVSYGLLGRGSNMMGGNQEGKNRMFIEQMIPHHEGAIAMAELALTKAKTNEVKSLAQDIIESQQREIDEMKSWYRAWYGTEVPQMQVGGDMMGHGMHMDTFTGDLATLAQAASFDLEFVNQMIPHHEMAVMMTNMMLSGTEREELKTLADQIITSQSREITMMRSWQKVWRNQ